MSIYTSVLARSLFFFFKCSKQGSAELSWSSFSHSLLLNIGLTSVPLLGGPCPRREPGQTSSNSSLGLDCFCPSDIPAASSLSCSTDRAELCMKGSFHLGLLCVSAALQLSSQATRCPSKDSFPPPLNTRQYLYVVSVAVVFSDIA